MRVTGPNPSCSRLEGPWDGPRGHVLSYRRAAVVLLALLVAPGAARATQVCHFPDAPSADYTNSRCNQQLTWPTTWHAIDAGKTEVLEAGYDSGFNLIRSDDDTYPGMYVVKMYVPSRSQYYLFFRVRVARATVTAASNPYTGSRTLFWMMTTTADVVTNYYPTFSVAWDMQGWPNHGLEMAYQSATYGSGDTGKWNETNFSDLDGNSGARGSVEIDGNGIDQYEGYLRTVDAQPFGSSASYSGDTTFVDFAVSCAYFTRVANARYPSDTLGPYTFTFNPCTQPFYSAAALSSVINDNNPWGAGNVPGNTDLFGTGTWTASTTVSSTKAGIWNARFDPTAVVVSGITSRATGAGVEVTWSTASEVGTIGFNLHRIEPGTGTRIQVNRHLVAAIEGSPNGGRYVVEDPGASPVAESTYLLEEIEHGGGIRTYGPFTVRPGADGSVDGEFRVGASGWARTTRSDDAGATRVTRAQRDDSRSRTYAPSGQKARARHSSPRSGPASGAARVLVATEGLQALDSAVVAASLGMTDAAARAAIRSRKLSITGPEGPVACEPSEDGARVYFHGKPIGSTWSSSAVYWLTRGECRRFDVLHGPPLRGRAPAATVFTDLAHVEQDLFPMPILFREPWEDFWLWTQLIGSHPTLGAATYLLAMPGATGGPGAITVNLQGQSTTGTGRDHHVRLTLNGTLLGDTAWAGDTAASASFTVPAGIIVAGGANAVRLETLRDEGVPYSVVGLDSFEVSWQRNARATADQLRMPKGLTGDVVVDGFSASDIWVLDLGDPARPRRLGGVQTGDRDGESFVRYGPPASGGPFLAVRPLAAAVPVVEVVPPRARLETLGVDGADYLVITSERLAAASTALAELRAARGMRVLVVTVEQIYDEYDGGNPDPQAIRAFLSDVHRSWRRVPRFLVLAGSGTFDGRGVMGVDDNHVPPLLVLGTRGLGPSDVALADVAGDDGVPEFAIGRIPASTESELLAYVEKLKAYELDAGAWSGRALFLADDPDQGGDFPTDSLHAIDRLGGRMTVEQLDHLGDVDATRAHLGRALGEGVGLFHYLGHAAADRLGNEGLLTSSDVDAMADGGRTPIALLMTCGAGLYAYPGYDSLAVRLAKKTGGGAIAVVAPSSLEWESDSRVLGQAMLSAWSSGTRSVGEAFVLGLAASRDGGSPIGMRRTYTLFGDPAVELKP